MTHRVFRHAALGAAAALATLCLSAPGLAAPAGASSSALPRLDITGVYVAGVSSGGFMASVILVNPEGCWDWWGYDGPNFAVKSAPQMVTIMKMVHALGG